METPSDVLNILSENHKLDFFGENPKRKKLYMIKFCYFDYSSYLNEKN